MKFEICNRSIEIKKDNGWGGFAFANIRIKNKTPWLVIFFGNTVIDIITKRKYTSDVDKLYMINIFGRETNGLWLRYPGKNWTKS